jgi:hypothetical protein
MNNCGGLPIWKSIGLQFVSQIRGGANEDPSAKIPVELLPQSIRETCEPVAAFRTDRADRGSIDIGKSRQLQNPANTRCRSPVYPLQYPG